MATTLSLRTRARVVAGLTALMVLGSTAPAWAEDAPMPGNANDTLLSSGQLILVFGGIPLLVVAAVYLLAAAPGWTRSGRVDAGEAWTGDPVTVVGSVVPSSADQASAGAVDGTGGTSARW